MTNKKKNCCSRKDNQIDELARDCVYLVADKNKLELENVNLIKRNNEIYEANMSAAESADVLQKKYNTLKRIHAEYISKICTCHGL